MFEPDKPDKMLDMMQNAMMSQVNQSMTDERLRRADSEYVFDLLRREYEAAENQEKKLRIIELMIRLIKPVVYT